MGRERIQTSKAPAAIGPYSQGIVVDNFVYTAGQVAIDPATGRLVEGGIEEQSRQALENLKAILVEAGSSLEGIVKTTVFLSDMANFAAMNKVYSEYFGTERPPARSTVQVAGLPLGAMVEIECVAVLGTT
ncbi:MAG: RidA family protein [Chloroflexi bacterium]|nr:RidA family protein [Chloroflexota bacterium]